MKLTIVYHVYRNSLTLKKSLSILANQSDKNFELILIDDAATSNVSRIISEFDFSKFTKFTYIKHSQNLGHSISFNQVNNILNSSHVIYVGSNFVPHKNFVKVVNDVIAHHPTVDVISFKNVKNDCSCEVFTKLDNKMRLNLDSSMKDKIFSLNLLNKNQIQLSENMYAPLIFIYKALINFKKWIIIDFKQAVYSRNRIYTYNFYDIFNQNDYLIEHYSKSTFWKANIDLINFFMIIQVLITFLVRFFNVYTQKSIRTKAINNANDWLNKNIPNWRTNKILSNSIKFKSLALIKFKTKSISNFIKKSNL